MFEEQWKETNCKQTTRKKLLIVLVNMRRFLKITPEPLTLENNDDVFLNTVPQVTTPKIISACALTPSAPQTLSGSVHSASCVDGEQTKCKFTFDTASNSQLGYKCPRKSRKKYSKLR